jgi:hypothetical protein
MSGLGTKEEMADSFLLFIVASKLDVDTLYKWKQNKAIPSWDEFSKFLNTKCSAMETVNACNSNSLAKSKGSFQN